MKIVLAAGGTVGHLSPALKAAEIFRKRNYQVCLMGRMPYSYEKTWERNFFYRPIPARGLLRKTLWSYLLFFICNAAAFVWSLIVLLLERPRAVVGFGGYSSAPVILAAAVLRIPAFLHEQNVIPGRANKLLKRFAREIFLSFPESGTYFDKTKTIVSGCPVLFDAPSQSREELLDFFGLDKGKKTLLVFGGSQGARRVNEVFVQTLDFLKEQSLQVIHITGDKDYETVKSLYETAGIPYALFSFLREMHYAYAVSDLAVCRSGAATVTELTKFACPAILIPYPHAVENHQFFNAKVISERGLARIIEEKDLNPNVLQETICDMINRMASFNSYKNININKAEEIIVTEVIKYVQKA